MVVASCDNLGKGMFCPMSPNDCESQVRFCGKDELQIVFIFRVAENDNIR